MGINASNVTFRLSGGAGNSNVNASLGGVMSSTLMQSQSTPVLTTSGLQLTYAGGMSVGVNNTFRHTYVTGVHYLEYKDYLDGSYGPPVVLDANGTFYLAGASHGVAVVNVVLASLPVTTVTENFQVTNIKNNLFDDVAKADALSGMNDYRCIYIHNSHATEDLLQVGIYGYGSSGNPAAAGDKFYVGADPAGLGNGSTTGVATTISPETAVPSGVTFSSPEVGSPLLLGSIGPLQSRAIWLKRAVPAALYAVTPDDFVYFGLKVIF